MSLTHSHTSESPEHSRILSAIAELKNDKAALKSALKSALSKREELLQRVAMYEESSRTQAARRKEVERECALLRRDNGDLAQRAEDCRKEAQRLAECREEDIRTIAELRDKLRAAETATSGSRRSCFEPTDIDSNRDNDAQKYTQFLLEKLEEEPEVLNLFHGRVGSLRLFWSNLQMRRYSECYLSVVQFVSDLLMYRTHNARSGGNAQQGKRSASSQTLVDRSTNTSPQTLLQRPSITGLKASLKSKPFSDVPDYLFSTSSTLNGDGVLSPNSVKSVGFTRRGEGEYSKLIDESEHLLTTLHQQSDRLSRLNSQIQHTMQSGTRKTPLRTDSTPSLYSRAESVSPSRIPYIGIPSSPQSLRPVQESAKREENSTELPSNTQLLTPANEPVSRKPTSSVSKRSLRKPTPSGKVPHYKTDVGCMQERVQPSLRKEENWDSVSAFFAGEKDEEQAEKK